MSSITKEIVTMLDMLPEGDQLLVSEIVKKLVLAWDPDFTKLTADEHQALKEARSSGYTPASKIDWGI